MTTILKTSEAVSIGHPDKVADQIADAIFDLLRTYKESPQSAVEISCGANKLLIFGEIDRDIVGSGDTRIVEELNPTLIQKIRETAISTIRSIGYTEAEYDPTIIVDLVTQSQEINQAVEKTDKKSSAAGDQGIVSGYATAETINYHELHFILAHEILKELEKDNRNGLLKPDAKSQVTVSYVKDTDGIEKPVAVKHILLSQSHSEKITVEELRIKMSVTIIDIITQKIRDIVLSETAQNTLIHSLTDSIILINPAGAWHHGGPKMDSGLTGRKLVVDNYGSSAPIGGGSTAGKDANKVDRSGAYYARKVAKSIVASGLAHKAQVELGFAIAVEEPTSININTFDTETVPLDEIYERVYANFPFTVEAMIEECNKIEQFVEASQHGNYTNNSFPWEQPISL